MPPPSHLLHLPLSVTPFARAALIQRALASSFLLSKPSRTAPSAAVRPPPPPTIITSEFSHPVYTLGRRDFSSPPPPLPSGATIIPTLRGGQTTYHGPGQVTAYVVADIRSLGFTPRCWIHMLEGSVIDTLASFGIEAGRVKEYPGVWVGGGERKVCAVGVHLRRNVASFGVGLNVNPDLKWFEEIIACGLPGDKTTSIEKEGVTAGVEDVAERFVEMARKRMKLETMEKGDWKEILWLYGGKEVVKEAMTEGIW